MSSIQPRKQRRALHNAPLHKQGRQLRAHLSEELLVKFGKRSTSVRVGDTVKILRGGHKGESGDVVTVDRRDGTITIEGITVAKSDGKQKPKPMHPSDVILTKLDLSDKLRRAKLGASEADATPARPKAKKAEEKPEPDSDPRARAAAKRAMKEEAEPPGAEAEEPEPEEPEEPEPEDVEEPEEERR